MPNPFEGTSTNVLEHSPELRLVWSAQELPGHRDGGFLDGPSLETSNIPTTIVEGTVELVKGDPIDWKFEWTEKETHRVYGLFNGFLATGLSSAAFSHAMAVRDKPLLSMEPARKSDEPFCSKVKNPHTIQVEAMYATLEALTEETGIKFSRDQEDAQLITIGHSKGGEPALEFAEEHPDVSEYVILLATIGFRSLDLKKVAKKLADPRNTIAAVTEEFIPFFKHEATELSWEGLKKVWRYVREDPAITAGEIISCLTSEQSERVNNLRRLGIRTTYLEAEHDVLIEGIHGARGAVDWVGTIEGVGHMLLQAKPDKTADWVSHAVAELDAHKQAA